MRSSYLPLFLLLVGTAAPAREDTPSALVSSSEGWTDLLADAGPGPDLKGWTRVPIPPTGTLKPVSQWSLDTKTGILLCQGDGGHEWLRWDKPVGNSILHVEWKYTKVEGKKGYNAGVFARNSADGVIWHQAQTGDGNGGYLFGNSPVGGKPKGFNLNKPPRERREKPPGEWNTYEIRCRGKEIILWVNGADVSTYATCEVPEGYVGLEAEGWRIEFRNVKLKALAP